MKIEWIEKCVIGTSVKYAIGEKWKNTKVIGIYGAGSEEEGKFKDCTVGMEDGRILLVYGVDFVCFATEKEK